MFLFNMTEALRKGTSRVSESQNAETKKEVLKALRKLPTLIAAVGWIFHFEPAAPSFAKHFPCTCARRLSRSRKDPEAPGEKSGEGANRVVEQETSS